MSNEFLTFGKLKFPISAIVELIDIIVNVHIRNPPIIIEMNKRKDFDLLSILPIPLAIANKMGVVPILQENQNTLLKIPSTDDTAISIFAVFNNDTL